MYVLCGPGIGRFHRDIRIWTVAYGCTRGYAMAQAGVNIGSGGMYADVGPEFLIYGP